MWSNTSESTQCSRLDFWLISANLESVTSSCVIIPSPLTDHCATTPLISHSEFHNARTSYWKFNSSLLKNSHFCNRIRTMITEIKAMTELTPSSKWEWLKFNVRKISIEEGKAIARIRKQLQAQIISKINLLHNSEQLNEENQIELNQ